MIIPRGNNTEGGPQPMDSYRNNLNHIEFTAKSAGPKCGNVGHVIGLTSLLNGAIDTNKLHINNK